MFETLLLLFNLEGPPPGKCPRKAWTKARQRCAEIAESRNVADFFYPPQQQVVDSRDQVHTHRASDEGPGSAEYRARYRPSGARDFAAEERYRKAAEDHHTAEFLRSQSATASRINTPPPPPAQPPPPPGPPPPNHPPPKNMMSTRYYGLTEDTLDVSGGSRLGFRHVERNSQM